MTDVFFTLFVFVAYCDVPPVLSSLPFFVRSVLFIFLGFVLSYDISFRFEFRGVMSDAIYA